MDSNFSLKPEDELLLSCVSTQKDEEIESKIKELVKLDLNWNYLLEITSRHRVQPLLYYRLSAISSDVIPPGFMDNLKELINFNAHKNLFFMKEAIELVKTLKKHDIKSVPYKGPVLAQQVYGNLTMRQFGDLDLLVKKEDVIKIKEILILRGYKTEFEMDPVQERNYLKSQRELKFIHELKDISVELHWKFSGIFLNLPSKAEKTFLSDMKSYEVGEVSIPEIAPENLLLILSIHNASHYWSRISWLVDIATLINLEKIDWLRVLNVADELSIKKILLINLYLCQRLLNLELEKEISNNLTDEAIKVSNVFIENYFQDKAENSLMENVKLSMKIRERTIDGINDCLSGIFKPSFYELKHLNLPSSLFFLYYLYRPLNLLKRYKFYK